MPKRKSRRPSKKGHSERSRQSGWHAKGKDVVALLANFAIEVDEGLVSKIKVDSLKRSDEVKRHEEKLKRADKRRISPMVQKKPQQRTYRR